jgi:hypothetical protein
MAAASELLNIQAIIDEFAADPLRSSMELPHMTTGQRKTTKQLLESHPELKCQSFGFGPDRKLHLFKVESAQAQEACVSDAAETEAKVLMVSDAAETEAKEIETVAGDSHDDGLPANSVQCVMDGPVCKLDLASIRDAASRASAFGEAFLDDSTIAPSSCASDGSPASTFRGMPPWFRLPPGLELEVQNTFIHFKKPQIDQRIVQSMPHCMFQKCLLAEISSGHEKTDRCCIGAEVTIMGLSKLPAFNGLRGTVQSLDEQSGRYIILLAAPVSGHKTVKVKRENFHVASAEKDLQFSMERTEAPRSLKLTALV